MNLPHNLLNKQLSQKELQILEHGERFNMRDATPREFIVALESILKRVEIEETEKHAIR